MNSLFTLASSIGVVSMFDLLLTVIGTIMVCGIGVFLFKQVSNNLDDALSGTFDTIFSFFTKLELGKDNKSLLSATEQNMAMLSEDKDNKPNPNDGSGGLGGLMSDNKLAGSVIGASSAVGDALGLGGGFEAVENPGIDNNDTISDSPLMKNTSDEDEKSLAGESANVSTESDEEEKSIESTSGSISEHDDAQEESLAGVSGNGAREDEESITQSSTGGSTLSQDMDDEIGGIDAGEIADGEDTESEQTHTNHLDLEQTVDEETDMNLDDADGISADDAALAGMATAASATRMKDLNIDTDTNENMVDDSDGHFADSAGATEGISINGQNLDIDAQNGNISGDEFDANNHDEALNELEGANNGEFSDIDLDDVDNVVAITEGNEMTDYDIRAGSEAVDNPYDDGTYSPESDAQERAEMLDTPYADNYDKFEADTNAFNYTEDNQMSVDGSDARLNNMVNVGDNEVDVASQYDDGNDNYNENLDTPTANVDGNHTFENEAFASNFDADNQMNADGSDVDLNNMVNIGDSNVDVASQYDDGNYNYNENFDTPDVSVDNYNSFEADTNGSQFAESNQVSVAGSTGELDNMVDVGDNDMNVSSEYNDGQYNYNEQTDTLTESDMAHNDFAVDGSAANYQSGLNSSVDGQQGHVDNMVNVGDSDLDVSSDISEGNFNYNDTSESYQGFNDDYGTFGNVDVATSAINGTQSSQVDGGIGNIDNVVSVGDDTVSVASNYEAGSTDYNETSGNYQTGADDFNAFGAVEGQVSGANIEGSSHIAGQHTQATQHVSMDGNMVNMDMDIANGDVQYTTDSASINQDMPTFTGDSQFDVNTVNAENISTSVMGDVSDVTQNVDVEHGEVNVSSAFNDTGYGNVNTESPLFNDNGYGSFDGGSEMNAQSVDIADMSYDTSVSGGQVQVDNHTSSKIGQVTRTGSSDTSSAYQSSDTVQADSFERPNFDSNPLNNHADYNYSDGNTINTSSNIHGDIENAVNSVMNEDIDYSVGGANQASSISGADDYNGNQSNGFIRPQVMGETTSSVTNDDYDVSDVMNTTDNTNINHDVIHNQRSTVSQDYDDSSYQNNDYNDLDAFNTPNETHQVMNGANSQSIDTENRVDLNVDNMFDVDQHQQFDVNETNFRSSNSQSTFSNDLFGESFEENPSKNISNSISRKGYVVGNVDMTASEVGLFADNNYDTFNDVDDNY